MHQQAVILFDGVCNFCCAWVLFLIKRDKKELFLFASLQSEVAEQLLKPFGVSNTELNTVIYIKNNTCLQQSTAALEILTDLGGIWRLWGIFKLIPEAVRNVFYRFIAGTRYKVFGKKDRCMVPSSKIRKRFLS